jgi:hypothetical protein
MTILFTPRARNLGQERVAIVHKCIHIECQTLFAELYVHTVFRLFGGRFQKCFRSALHNSWCPLTPAVTAGLACEFPSRIDDWVQFQLTRNKKRN